MPDVFEKEDRTTLKKKSIEPKEVLYDYAFLKRQRQNLVDVLAEVDLLISEADKLGIKEKADVAVDVGEVVVP